MICKNCADLADEKTSHDVADCDDSSCSCQHKPLGSWKGVRMQWYPEPKKDDDDE